jgi:hypothetical protein
MKNAYIILDGYPAGKSQLERHRYSCEDIITGILKKQRLRV